MPNQTHGNEEEVRFSVTIDKELEAVLIQAHQQYYRECSRSQMLHDLIERGLNGLNAEKGSTDDIQ